MRTCLCAVKSNFTFTQLCCTAGLTAGAVLSSDLLLRQLIFLKTTSSTTTTMAATTTHAMVIPAIAPAERGPALPFGHSHAPTTLIVSDTVLPSMVVSFSEIWGVGLNLQSFLQITAHYSLSCMFAQTGKCC